MKNMYCLGLVLATAACGSSAAKQLDPTDPVKSQHLAFGRIDATVAVDANATLLAEDYDAGSIAMYKVLAAGSTSNMVFSAYAVQTAMGMMYAGSGGNTATNMAQALHWRLSPADLPAAHQVLTTVLATDANADTIELQTGTRLWYDAALGLNTTYAAKISQDYAAEPVELSLLKDPDGSAATINQWASDQTHGLIPQLIPQGGLGSAAVVVQTAAIYFKSAWQNTFTRDGSTTAFTHVDSSQSNVTMIRNTDPYPYLDGNSYQAVDVPYGTTGSTALLIVMPKGAWADFEQSLDGAFVHDVLAGLHSTTVSLAMPVLDLKQTPDMTATLRSMGLTDAFTPAANFSGVGTAGIAITNIYEQATLKLDENGTEAAAASAVVGSLTSAPLNPASFTVDHPFFFALHDTCTGTPLFTGRVLAP